MTKWLRPGNSFRSLLALFSLFGSIWKLTVFAIWKHLEAQCFRYLEASGSSLFSLFGNIWKLTVFAIWKYLEAHCFRYLALFWHWKDKTAKTVSFQILPKQRKQFLVLNLSVILNPKRSTVFPQRKAHTVNPTPEALFSIYHFRKVDSSSMTRNFWEIKP